MKTDDLILAWSEEASNVSLTKTPSEIARAIRRKRRYAWLSMLLTIAVSMVMALVFALRGPSWLASHPWLRILSAVPIAMFGVVAACSCYALLSHPRRRAPSCSVIDGLQEYIFLVDHEMWFLQKSSRWFLIPMPVVMQIMLAVAYARVFQLADWQLPLAFFIFINVLVVVTYLLAYIYVRRQLKKLCAKRSQTERLLHDLRDASD